MQNKPFVSLIATALLASGGPGSAATIIDNFTGLQNSTFTFLDYESTGGTVEITSVGTITNNRSGTAGNDGDGNAFGNLAAYASAGEVIYTFAELVPGQEYSIYANWYGNGTANCAIDVSVNFTNLGTFVQTATSSAGATGFTAHDEVNDPLASEARGFTLLGTAIADMNGDLAILSSKSTTNSFGRFDAFAVAPIPEPSVALLGGLGVLALLRRRR